MECWPVSALGLVVRLLVVLVDPLRVLYNWKDMRINKMPAETRIIGMVHHADLLHSVSALRYRIVLLCNSGHLLCFPQEYMYCIVMQEM